jgi:hypothetical protein
MMGLGLLPCHGGTGADTVSASCLMGCENPAFYLLPSTLYLTPNTSHLTYKALPADPDIFYTHFGALISWSGSTYRFPEKNHWAEK